VKGGEVGICWFFYRGEYLRRLWMLCAASHEGLVFDFSKSLFFLILAWDWLHRNLV
jgi:hypothetical protein